MDSRTRRRLAWVRHRWIHLDRAQHEQALRRLDLRDEDPTTSAWMAILAQRHPFVRWLFRDDDPPEVLEDGTSLQQLLASHPFPEVRAWSSPVRSPASSSTPRG
ncbi:MAG: hypothetical protein H6732_05855 [Alphaproteobacteria bacterium]|nr:hypothetical protein [Alphaproteobacteria bacterium]